MIRLIIFLRPAAKYLLLAWALTILIVSSIPNIPTLKIHTARAEYRLDYLMHFTEYGILTFVTFLSFAGTRFRVKFIKIFLITLCLALFAVMDELHQKLIPGRAYSIRDIISDVSGVVAMTFFSLIIFRAVRKQFLN